MRVAELIYDQTSTSGNGLDTASATNGATAVLGPVGQYEALLGFYVASGGAPTACQAYIQDPKTMGSGSGAAPAWLAFGAAATPSGVSVPLFNWGVAVTGGSGPIATMVPGSVRFTVGAIVAQTVRFIVIGIRSGIGG